MKRLSILAAVLVTIAIGPGRAHGQVAYTYTTIDIPGGQSWGINNLGQIVGELDDGSGQHGFVRSPSGVITTFDVPGARETTGFGINNVGQIVGAWALPQSNVFQGFLRSPAGAITSVGPAQCFIYGINDAGLMVGSTNTGGVLQGLLLNGSSSTTFSVPGSTRTEATGINSAGLITGPCDFGGFLRTADGNYTTFNFPGANSIFPQDINEAGDTVGDLDRPGFPFSGFLRTAAGTFSVISFPGANGTDALGINDLGQIVGVYSDASGPHTFLATPVPEPTSLALLGIGGLAAIWRRRRARVRNALARNSPSAPRLVLSCLVSIVALSGATSAQAQVVYSFTPFDYPGARHTDAFGINNSGQTVGQYFDGFTQNFLHGFLRSSTGVFTQIDYPGAVNSEATGINSAGQIVGFYYDSASLPHGFVRSNGAYTSLNFPGAVGTYPIGINSAGQVVGYYYADSAQTNHAFLFSGGTYTNIDAPNSIANEPAGINNAGQTVGFYVDPGHNVVGYRRDADGTFTTLAFPGASQTFPAGINSFGAIVGSSDQGNFILHGDMYSPFPLAPGFLGVQGYGINDLEQIVGNGTASDGTDHAFIATPVPEPSSLALLGIGGLVATLRRRRRIVQACLVIVVALSGSPQAQAQVAYSFTSIDPPGSMGTSVNAVTNSGVIVGTYFDGNASHGFLRSSTGTFTTLDFPSAFATAANGINAAGQIVGGYTDQSQVSHSFIYSGGAFTSFNVPGASQTYGAAGINASGQIVGAYADSAQNTHGYLLSGGAFTSLDYPGSLGSFGTYGINDAGHIVGDYIDASSNILGYVRSPSGAYTSIAFPGAVQTDPFGINAFGTIVGEYFTGSDFGNFIFRNGSFSDFATSVPGFAGISALGINDLDQVVGYYQDGVSQRGFLATPVPEPTSLVLLGIGGGLFWIRRRRIAEKQFLVIAVFGIVALSASAAHAQPVTMYMSTGLNNRIDQITPPGPPTQFAALPASLPEGLVFDHSGNLFVAGAQDVFKITPNGVATQFATLPPGAGGFGMAMDSGGNFYVADVALSEISKITPGGVVSHFATIAGASPTGLAFDASGNLFVSASGNIKKVSPDGSTVTNYATLPPGFNNNYGLAFDIAGNLYSADAAQSTILKIAPGGGSISNFGSPSAGSLGLTFDNSGNLYLAESSLNQIEMIQPNGQTSLFTAGLDNPRFLAIGPTVVPEPSSLALLGMGSLAVMWRRRRVV